MTVQKAWYSVSEVAIAYGISESTVLREVRRGRLTAARIGERSVRIPIAALRQQFGDPNGEQ